MKKIALVFICLMTQLLYSQSANVKIENQADGQKLLVDGKPLMINGMNWDYYPIGTNYNYLLWNQKDDFIKTALDSQMSLLKNMGVNAIRVFQSHEEKISQSFYL